MQHSVSSQVVDLIACSYALDSDFCRVRVLGLSPSASELQYIDKKRIDEARERKMHAGLYEPLIAEFHVSGGGSA